MVTKNLRGLTGEKLDNGKYVIVKPLDEGGMGAVWTAKAVSMDTDVVVKFPLAEFLHEEGFRERFENEIRSLISLCNRHANIVNILDVGVYGDIPYAVMQYLTGGNLKDWTTRLSKHPSKETIDWTRVLRWIMGVADALDFVHRNRVIHRDIKPANILFDEGRNAYIADFGISKSIGKEGPTKTNQVVGTLSYMAPEVLRGDSATHLSDQYAFAATLYKSLTGEVPFSGATEVLLHQNQQSPPRRLETWGYLPSNLTAVVFKALNYDPERRFSNCSEFASEVLRSLANPASSRKMPPQPQPTEDTATRDTKRSSAVAEDTNRSASGTKSTQHRGVVPAEIVKTPNPGSGVQSNPRPTDTNATIVKQPTAGTTIGSQTRTAGGSGSTSTVGTGRDRNLRRLTCPWCWHAFSLAELLWVGVHNDLDTDDKLPEQPQRFLPEIFTENCQAIDVLGSVCEQTACPNCHLEIPRESIENDAVYLSIVGAALSGKSCYLSSLVHKLRQTFPQKFELSFSDADPELNGRLINNEKLLFNNRSSSMVKVDKTKLEDDSLYRNTLIGGVATKLLKPSIFTLKPTPTHPNFGFSSSISYSLCLYDNAGEHFSPGSNRSTSPVTRHLGLSDATIFIFDPTQHSGFRRACAASSTDPQFTDTTETPLDPQDTVLTETMRRIRNSTNQPSYKYEKPLIVVVNKYDAWASVFSLSRLAEPWVRNGQSISSAIWVRDIIPFWDNCIV